MKKFKRLPIVKKLALSWQKALNNMLALGGLSSHNHIHIYHDGDEAFHAIFKAIREAQNSIYVETYIFAQDNIGKSLRDALVEASSRGVAVTLLYDHFGSVSLSNAFLQPLRNAGALVLAFNPIWPWRRRGPLLFRDHRKIIVIDKRKAFCGSMNISSDYAGPKLGTNRFRDSLAEISGPAALDLLQITIESIQESLFKNQTNNLENPIIFVNNKLSINMIIKNLMRKKLSLFSQEQSDSTVQVLRSNTRRNLTHIQKAMEECLNRAVDYCYFTTPYFLPYDNLRKAIIMPPGVALTCEFSPLAYQTSAHALCQPPCLPKLS